jgi:toxin ParE1/3/4
VRRVVWTEAARRDIERIRRYVAEHRPLAAIRLAQRLFESGDNLANDSERGRAIVRGRRELTVVHPYLIQHRVKGDTVVILEVRHGARRP